MSSDRWTYDKPKATPGQLCVDCLAEVDNDLHRLRTRRPASYPGPRCATHHNAKKRNARISRKVRHVENTYGLTAEQYDALYAFQGGECALKCGAKGTGAKRLAVDHDHHQAMLDGHAPDKGCPKCVRGLVCSVCNDVLAHARSNPRYGRLLAAYLESWPMKRQALGYVWPPYTHPSSGV